MEGQNVRKGEDRMKPRHASPDEISEAHSRSISIFGGVFLRLSQSEQQDHYQHMRDEQSHPEDDDIGYDD